MARDLKFWILEVEGLYYPFGENKDADQLRGYRKADLRLCFRICKKPVFSRRGSYRSSTFLPSVYLSTSKCVYLHLFKDASVKPCIDIVLDILFMQDPDPQTFTYISGSTDFVKILLRIRLTCPCKVDPLTPHFYIVNWGLQGYNTIFLFLL